MSDTTVGMNTASTVLGSLGKMSGNPEVSTGFALASLATGVIGSIIGANAAENAATAQAKYRKAVLLQLTTLSTNLSAVKTELGSIETELTAIDEQLKSIKGMKISTQLATIDSFYQDFQGLTDNSTNASALKTLATEAFDPTTGVIKAMNNVNDMITSAIFGPNSALQGEISISGYMYVKTKLLQGLHVLGYASCFSGYDFGANLMTWSQIFANQMQIIIAYGEANPTKVDVYTAQFNAYWGGEGLVGGAGAPLYTSDCIPFSASVAPIMPCDMVIFGGNEFGTIVFDGSAYKFENRFNAILSPPAKPVSVLFASWNVKQSQLTIPMSYNSPFSPSPITEDLTITQEATTSPGYSSPFDSVYSMDIGASQNPGRNQKYIVGPKIAADPGSGIYLGSVDGMLNFLPATNGSKSNPEPGKIIAFLYDGTTKGNLLTSSESLTIESKALSDLTTLKYCAVEIIFHKAGIPGVSSPEIYIKFCASQVYLDMFCWKEQPTKWVFHGTPEPLTVSTEIQAQLVQSPYAMTPVHVYLNTGAGDTHNANGSPKAVIVHPSPFTTLPDS